MKKIGLVFFLLCSILHPCGAQLRSDVGPGDGPDGPGMHVARVGATLYSSLTDAIDAVNATGTDGKTVLFLNRVALTGTDPVRFDQTMVLDLNSLSLTCASGTRFQVATGKMLILENGICSGSFQFSGKLFAGEDAIVKDCSVSAGSGAGLKSVYRILVRLPGTESEGNISNVEYGGTAVPYFSRQGDMLCCWIQQSVAARSLTFSYTPVGESPKNYITDPLTVTLHAESSIGSKVNDGPGDIGNTSVAEVVRGEGDVMSYKTLAAAFAALKDVADQAKVKLLTSCSLNEVVEVNAHLELDLNGCVLSSEGTAGFKKSAAGSLNIKNSLSMIGSMSGLFSVTPGIIIDKTVLLPASIMLDGKQVYRTRLSLPVVAADAAFSYGDVSDGKFGIIQENRKPVGYLWLRAQTAASFVLTYKDATGQRYVKTKKEVVILPNHDNTIEMTEGGDAEATLYKIGEKPGEPGAGIPFDTFHDALNEAGKNSGSSLWLNGDVYFSGTSEHDHKIIGGVVTELHLNGHNLIATNCILDASAAGACLLVCDADRGTGRITGTFKMKGSIYIGDDVSAGNIGVILQGDGNNMQLYRVLVPIRTSAVIPDGFATYTLGHKTEQVCYVKNKVACLWQPLNAQPETLSLTIGGNTYTAGGVQLIASHSNAVTVKEPTVIATIGMGDMEQTFTSLSDAFTAARDGDEITLQQSTVLNALLTIPDHFRLELDLKENTLTTTGEAGFATSSAAEAGSLLIHSSEERGIISGNFTVSNDVCVAGTVSLSGLVTRNGETVYRTRMFLPEGSRMADYTYNTQTGSLTFINEKNPIGLEVAYCWMKTITGTHDLVVQIATPVAETKTLSDVMIQATHNNQFNMIAGENLAQVGNQYYPTFSAALAAVNKAGGGTITLVKDQTLRGLQTVTTPVVLDLNGCRVASTADMAFDVGGGNHSLLITDYSKSAEKGYLYGTIMLNGPVYISEQVKLIGTVVSKGQEIFRFLIDGLPADKSGGASLKSLEYIFTASGNKGKGLCLNGTACLWLTAVTTEQDIRISASDGNMYETTLLSTVPEHNKHRRAYRLVSVVDDTTWTDNANEDCNVFIAPGVTLTIRAGSGLKTLHRVTMGNLSQVVCAEKVLATDGIVYHRTFSAPAGRWEAFSLPYDARRITTVKDGEIVNLSPHLSTGTGGHFWLKTLALDGSFSYVSEQLVRANTGYIIAVPEELTATDMYPDRAVSFTSSGNQYLQRTPVKPDAPEDGRFRQLANGTLSDIPLTQPFYLLHTNGTEYIRQDASQEYPVNLPPFSSYLLTDRKTVATQSSLRMGELPTQNEAEPVPFDSLKIYGGKGLLTIDVTTETLLSVYTFSGQLRFIRRIPAGRFSLNLPAGLYIVNQTKVCIK